MLRSLYTAATGMEAQQLKMDVIANNLANTSTTGVQEGSRRIPGPAVGDGRAGHRRPGRKAGGNRSPLQVGLGVKTGSTTRVDGHRRHAQHAEPAGPGHRRGSGYFRVQRAGGDIAFTRAGNLRVDETGRLVTQHGEIIEPAITVPPETTALTIKLRRHGAGDSSPTRPIPPSSDRLQLTTFTNPAALNADGAQPVPAHRRQRSGATAEAGRAGRGELSQGFLESSNVQAVEEMIDMISTQRSYEMNSKVIQTADQMLQRLTQLR